MERILASQGVGAMGAAVISAPQAHLSAASRARRRSELPAGKRRELRCCAWKRFVQGDEEQWLANSEKFYKATGVKVRVDSENFEDIRPKAAVAANVGSGPDIVLGWYDDPHQYADKLLDLTERPII